MKHDLSQMELRGRTRVWWPGLAVWGPVVAYAGVIFWLSAQTHPEEQVPSLFDLFGDKILHAVEYAGLGALCCRGFRWALPGAPLSRALFLGLVAASLYGITDEVHQLFVPFREAGWQDWLADTAGAAVGSAVAARLPGLCLFLPPRQR